MSKLRMRKDITTLSQEECDTLIRAFHHIVTLDCDDENSFFAIAGCHGLPSPSYCQHATVLFPTWHRAFLLRLETALRSAPGCGNMALPYWDQMSNMSMNQGLPAIFTDKKYTFMDGKSIPNPLYSYTMQQSLYASDSKNNMHKNGCMKHEGHATMRYPYSNMVNSKSKAKIEEHNAKMNSMSSEKTTQMLNKNIMSWLTMNACMNGMDKTQMSTDQNMYTQCLVAPNYTVFSNMASAQAWNHERMNQNREPIVVSLEMPHNAMHLAIGGFEVPQSPGSRGASQGMCSMACGDMGENDTAAFDPIFFFHHCFIDYMFWQWQEMHGMMKEMDIMAGFPGTVDNQERQLDMHTPLTPFTMAMMTNGDKRPMTSKDVMDISKLGYGYRGSKRGVRMPTPDMSDAPKVMTTGIDRSKIQGSFVVSTWAKGRNGQADMLMDVMPVLSRWQMDDCDNCRNYREVQSHMQLPKMASSMAHDMELYTLVHTRENPEGVKELSGMQVRTVMGKGSDGGAMRT